MSAGRKKPLQLQAATSSNYAPIDMLPDELLLAGVNREVKNQIVHEPALGDHPTLADKYHLARMGNRRFYSLFKKDASQCVCQFLHPFLLHVVHGNLKEAKDMIKANPKLLSILLCTKATVTDYSGREIKGTALQMALRAQDVSMNDQEGMAEMIMRYLKTIPNGNAESAKQISEQFPNGLEEQKPYDFSEILRAILKAPPADIQAALAKQDNGSLLCRALNQFREDFTHLSHQEINFNPQHLLEAFKIYDSDPLWRNHITQKQRDLFWRQVIGYVQCYSPACYMQAFNQGLYYIMENKESLKRFSVDGGVFFPLFSDLSGLGYDYTVEVVGGGRELGERKRSNHLEFPAARLFTEFMSSKDRELVEITPPRVASHCTLL